jgi:hypothetical protein
MKEIAWRTVASTPYYLRDDLIMLSMARVRLGSNEFERYEMFTRLLRLENGGLTIANDLENAWVNGCGWPIVINESILQSYTGAIRVNPVDARLDVQFVGLRAVGAFLVSGDIRADGYIAYLSITSEAGGTCRLCRPWSGMVRIRSWPGLDAVELIDSGARLEFESIKDAVYVVDHPEDPWELMADTFVGEQTTDGGQQ